MKDRKTQTRTKRTTSTKSTKGAKRTKGTKGAKRTKGTKTKRQEPRALDTGGKPQDAALLPWMLPHQPVMPDDWAAFAARLAAALATLEDEQFLILVVSHGTRFVQFASRGAKGLDAETKSNHFHDDETERLRPEQEAALQALGWNAPTREDNQLPREAKLDGSPNYFVEFPAPVPFEAVAALAVRTFVEVLGVTSPRRVTYTAFRWEGGDIELPTLDLKQIPSDESVETARQREAAAVLATFRNLNGDAGFTYQGWDGIDISAFRDGRLEFLSHRITDTTEWDEVGFRVVHQPITPGLLRVYAQLVAEVETSPALMAYLNTVNAGVSPSRLVHQHGAVYAIIDLLSEPFVAESLVWAIDELDEAAFRFGPAIQSAFGGRLGRPAPEPEPDTPDDDADLVPSDPWDWE